MTVSNVKLSAISISSGLVGPWWVCPDRGVVIAGGVAKAGGIPVVVNVVGGPIGRRNARHGDRMGCVHRRQLEGVGYAGRGTGRFGALGTPVAAVAPADTGRGTHSDRVGCIGRFGRMGRVGRLSYDLFRRGGR